MSLIVEGRKDKLLEKRKVARRTLILEFLNEFVMGKVFEDIDALKKALASWTKWSQGKAKDLHLFPEKIEVNLEQMTIWAGKSLGGEFVVGHIVENK